MNDVTLPSGWRWDTLDNVCLKITDGVHNSPKNERIGDVPYITAKNIRRFAIDLSDLTYISFADHEEIYKRCDPKLGDILYIKDGATLGAAAINTLDFEFSLLSSVALIRPNPVLLDNQFLAFWLNNPDTLQSVIETQTGSAIKRIVLNQIREMVIPLPPLPEQQRIAAIIEAQMAEIEAARAAAQAQLDAAEKLAAAYLRDVFESEAAQAWEIVPVGQIAEVTGGIQKQPSRKPVKFSRPYLTVRNVQRGWLDLSQVEEFEITPDELTRLRLQDGDMLIVEGNGSLDHIGRSAIFHNELEDCIHQNHVIRVRLNQSRAIPEFVNRYLNSNLGKTQMIDKARTSSGLYTLSVSKVQSLEVALPSIPVQQQVIETITRQIDEVEHATEALRVQLDLISQLPAALLRQAFQGEL